MDVIHPDGQSAHGDGRGVAFQFDERRVARAGRHLCISHGYSRTRLNFTLTGAEMAGKKSAPSGSYSVSGILVTTGTPPRRNPQRGNRLINRDSSLVLAQVLQLHTNLRPGGVQGKPFGPFQNGDAGSFEHVFHPESLEIVEAFDAIQIRVKDLFVFAVDVD